MALQEFRNIDLGFDGEIDISGIDAEYSNFRAFGIGKITEKQKKRRAKIKKAFHNVGKKIGDKLGGGKAVHAVNKFNPAMVLMRGGLLGMLNSNIIGVATNMSVIKNDNNQKHWNEIMQKFWMWGGNKKHIAKSVEKGKNKKPLAQGIMDKLRRKHGFDGYSNAGGKIATNVGLALAVTGAVGGVVGAAMVATGPALAVPGGVTIAGSGALVGLSPIFKSYAKDKGVPSSQVDNIPPPAPVISPTGTPSSNTLPTGFNPDVINPNLPTDPKVLAKIADEMNAITKAENKGTDPTLVSVHTDPALAISGDTILGIPKTAVYIGGAILALGILALIFKKSVVKQQ